MRILPRSGTASSVSQVPGSGVPRGRLGQRTGEAIAGYLFVLPDVIGLSVFVVLPIATAVYLSFHDWNGLSDPIFAGFDNFKGLFGDLAFWSSLRTTLVYVLIFVPSLLVVSLALAMLVNQKLKFTWFFRSAFFLPVMFSLVVASVVWGQIMQEKGGLLNNLLATLAIPPQPWLGSTSQALVAIVIVVLWQGVGYNMIIFLAGLQDIPSDIYDAAAVDGANAWSRFWRITVPLLRRTTVFVLITSLIAAFQAFDPMFVLTAGGPANSTTTTVFYIYQNAFSFLRLGYASAISLVLFLMILALSGLQLRVFRDTAD
jgi:multiple sugar transport system permease protein